VHIVTYRHLSPKDVSVNLTQLAVKAYCVIHLISGIKDKLYKESVGYIAHVYDFFALALTITITDEGNKL